MKILSLEVKESVTEDQITIPAGLLKGAGFQVGDRVNVSETPLGILVSREKDLTAVQIELARQGMREYRETLAELAK